MRPVCLLVRTKNLRQSDGLHFISDSLIDGDVWVTLEVAAEVVYVLKGVYHLDRQEISEKLMQFLELAECKENIVLRQALHTYAVQNLDFVDCILYAYNKVKGIEIATFDKKLLHLLAAQ